MEIVKQAHLKRGVYWHIFPTSTEAKDAVWRDPAMLFNIIPESLIEKKNEVEMVIYFKNGSIMQIKGADDPDALRGTGPCGIVLDEFAKMKYYAWEVVEPIIRANGGWAWFIGTPKGKNHLFNLYQRGKEGHHEWKSWLLKASQSGIIPMDQLLESKRTSTQANFNQEWECEFLEGEGSVFRGVRNICTAIPEKPEGTHMYVMGVDLAKVQDYTVVSVYDRSTNGQVYQDRFKTLEWPFQKKKIKAISDHYNHALTIIDATGIGDPIADDLIRAGVPIVSYKITEQSKKDLIEKLSIWVDQGLFKMLAIQETLFEFDNFTYEIGSTGRIRYGAPVGFHDDIVISQALAIWSLQPISKVQLAVPKTRIQRFYESAKEAIRQEDNEWGWEQV